mmetsp:Transcript_26708/g.58059  ORF Transcript_26708/g.58059 Transcript_26708/m.58059 type:complete len:326 (+) Transcript_26708:113-1090(+)|eukprot:CAMPEP_0206462112 /NCGR_PEP_ID=MMETSP0324_2-20121206/25784_1 /ASSEMBLY_ACC=CAM_ASM_000836 /TAXON_ID=2866 /ORGANISM="Crypthecodinium cohnii, Strain Seligo" /LENGTH=325 /DNA_ID=CAMNT_0053934205 /DNA_START=42 /DNA_END=1019 /DNA_ORIENTATION=+
MASMTKSTLLGLAVLLPGAQAWGKDGHTIIAHIADRLLDPEVNQTLYNDLGSTSLSNASTWCDDFDHTAGGRWSAELHYINYPGQSCGFQWARDCPNKDGMTNACNVGAIMNYTSKIYDKSLSTADRLTALKFVIHMTGDVHQPLHVASEDDEGGNRIKIHFNFGNASQEQGANLHKVWDDEIVLQMIQDLKNTSSQAKSLRGPPFPFHDWQVLAADLTKRVEGEWASNVTEWQKAVSGDLSSESIFKAGLSTVAEESAELSCAYAYESMAGSRIVSGDVLKTDYYQHNKPIVAAQLAKGGARLAKILKDALTASKKGGEEILTV